MERTLSVYPKTPLPIAPVGEVGYGRQPDEGFVTIVIAKRLSTHEVLPPLDGLIQRRKGKSSLRTRPLPSTRLR